MSDCLHLSGSDCSACVLLLLLFLPLPVLGPAAAVGGCGHTTDVSASDLPREQQQQHARAQARATDGRCLSPFAAARLLLLRRLSTQLPVHMLTTGHLQVIRDCDKERLSPFAAAAPHLFLRRLSGVPRCPSIC